MEMDNQAVGMSMEKTPVFRVGQRVIITLPRSDFFYRFDGKIGIIKEVNTMIKGPEYTIDIDDREKEIKLLEHEIEPYNPDLLEQHKELKCPECREQPIYVRIPDNIKSVKIIIFKCLFSATFDIESSVEEMQAKLDAAHKSGKLKEFGIRLSGEK